MTSREAQEEARDRWGEKGYARFNNIYPGDYVVGIRKSENIIYTYGSGKSFEEAFEDAKNNGY